MVYCVKCGQLLEEKWNYCIACGSALSADSKAVSGQRVKGNVHYLFDNPKLIEYFKEQGYSDAVLKQVLSEEAVTTAAYATMHNLKLDEDSVKDAEKMELALKEFAKNLVHVFGMFKKD